MKKKKPKKPSPARAKGFRLHDDEIEKLTKIAVEMGRTCSDAVRRLINEYKLKGAA